MNTTKILIAAALLGLLASSCAESQEIKPLVCVVNYPFQIWNDAPTKIHLCLFKPDFSPAAKARVEVDGRHVGMSDRDGACIFDYKPGNSAHRLTASLAEGGILYRVERDFKCNARSGDFHADRVYVYTDRAIYNPGQDILIRCIAWTFAGTYKPLEKARVKLVLQDREKHIYSGGHVATNEYGVAAFKIALPPNMREGSYDLCAIYDKVEETTPIKVQRFVPPVIRIEHNLPRYLTATQESLAAQVTLSFFAGGTVRKSQLELSVINGGKVIFSLAPPQQKPGHYNFILGKEQLEQIRSALREEQSFEITLAAKDEYGRTDAVTRELKYTARPYSATLEPAKQNYLAGETVTIVARVVERDRRPAPDIPLVLDAGSVKLNQKTDDRGTATFTFTMGSAPVSVQLSSPLVQSPLASLYVPLGKTARALTSEARMGPGNVEAEILASFDPRYVPVGDVVHLDLTDISGALVTASTLPITEEKDRYLAKGKVTSPAWGTLLANLYCCAVEKDISGPFTADKVGLITEGQKVTFHPAQKIFITFAGLKPRVKPGEKLSLEISVNAGEACLGVALVDEAVLSLGDPLEKKPADYFYDPQLKTIDGEASLLWPVLDRNWGQPANDIAYPNWGWKAPGDIHEKNRKISGDRLDIELVFVLDTMERMGRLEEAVADIRSAIRTISLARGAPQIKVGMVTYRSRGTDYVTRVTPLTSDLDRVYASLASVESQGLYSANGGAEVAEAISRAVDDIQWSSGAIKMIYLIGSTPLGNKKNYHEICARAAQKRLAIHTVSYLVCGPGTNCPLCADVERNFRQIAALTQGRYGTVLWENDRRGMGSALDGQLLELNARLDGTFVGYTGKTIDRRQDTRVEDVIEKAKNPDTFFARESDLVTAYRDDPAVLGKLSRLPSCLRDLTVDKRKGYLEEKLREREEIHNKILELSRRRRWEMEEKSGDFPKAGSIATLVVETVKDAARKRGSELGCE